MLIHVEYQLQLMSRAFSCAVVSYVLAASDFYKADSSKIRFQKKFYLLLMPPDWTPSMR